MNMAFDECECGHVAITHFSDTEVTTDSPCSERDCDCDRFVMKAKPAQSDLDHVPN